MNCIICGKPCEYEVCDDCTRPEAEHVKSIMPDASDLFCWRSAQAWIKFKHAERMLAELERGMMA